LFQTFNVYAQEIDLLLELNMLLEAKCALIAELDKGQVDSAVSGGELGANNSKIRRRESLHMSVLAGDKSGRVGQDQDGAS
jgi:hypothetical protein